MAEPIVELAEIASAVSEEQNYSVRAAKTGKNDEVSVLIVAEGATSRLSLRDRDAARSELEALNRSARAANAALGASDVQLLEFPDNRLDQVALGRG